MKIVTDFSFEFEQYEWRVIYIREKESAGKYVNCLFCLKYFRVSKHFIIYYIVHKSVVIGYIFAMFYIFITILRVPQIYI